MAITAQVVDGVLSYNYTDSSATSTENLGTTNLGYDEFLQLLCAEMQYQDPLEPTSNTDYIAQLATFSQLEATLSMQDSVDAVSDSSQMDFASSLVGKTVVVVDDESDTGYTSGVVDYVMTKDDTIYLSINDTLYSLDSLDTVATDEYYEAVVTSKTFSNMISELPKFSELTTSYKTTLEQIRGVYDGLSDYQKSFIDSDDLTTLAKYETKMAQLVAAEEAAEEETESDTESETQTETVEA